MNLVPFKSREKVDFRSLFFNKKYIDSDMRKGPGVDIMLDLHDIDLPAESVGTALLIDTIEHVEFPSKAIENVSKVLREDGFPIASTVMNFPIHNYPNDYWQFTPKGMKSLFQSYSYSFVDFLGAPEFPHSIIGIACRETVLRSCLKKFLKAQKKYKRFCDNFRDTEEKKRRDKGRKQIS